jgi:hypothetical protein
VVPAALTPANASTRSLGCTRDFGCELPLRSRPQTPQLALTAGKRDNVPPSGGDSCPIESIVSADTRTVARNGKNHRQKNRLRKIPSDRVRYTCRGHILSHAVPSAGLCCQPELSQQRNVPNAVLSCTLAANARTLTPQPASNAANRFSNALHAKTSAIYARFTRCVCA